MAFSDFKLPFLHRERLVLSLQQGADLPLQLVYAGAGYGKTTAVKQWLEKQRGPYIYLSLKDVHRLAEVLWLDFIKRLQVLHPEYAAQFEKIGIPDNTADYSVFIRLMWQAIEEVGKFYFVLDDYHLIEETPGNQFIHKLVYEQVPGLHIILVTRSVKCIEVEELVNRGLAKLITQEELAFSKEELADFLAKKTREGNNEAEELYKATAGWPFVIRLLYHTLTPEKDITYGIEDILPFVHMRLEKEFFLNYSPEIRQALVRLALPDLLRLPMLEGLEGCSSEAFWGVLGASPFILQEEGNLHIHPLYLEFLRTHTEVLPAGDIYATLTYCAKWLRRNNYLLEALNCHWTCNDYKAAWAVIAQFLSDKTQGMPTHSAAEHCLCILAGTPEFFIIENPVVLLHGAMLNFCVNNTRAAKGLLEKFRGIGQAKGISGRLLGEYYLLYGMALFLEWDAAFPEYWKIAHTLLEKSRIVDKRFGLMHLTPVFSPATLRQEDIENLLYANRTGIPYFINVTGGCGAGTVELVQAGVYYYRGRYNDAVQLLLEGMEKAQTHEQYDVLVNMMFYLIHSFIALGEYEKALEQLTVLKRYSSLDAETGVLLPMADYIFDYFDTMLRPPSFNATVQKASVKKGPAKARGRDASWAMLALLAGEQYKEALEYMQKAVEKLKKERNQFPLCYVLGLGSFAAARLGLHSYSCILLEEAYQAANNGEYTTTFVQGGQRTLVAIEEYRQTIATHPAETCLPREWLDNVEALCKRWLANLHTMEQVYAGSLAEKQI